MVADIQGVEIEVGDFLAYSVMAGRSSVLATYEVIGFTTTGKVRAMQIVKNGRDTWQHKPSTFHFPEDRAVILEKGKFKK